MADFNFDFDINEVGKVMSTINSVADHQGLCRKDQTRQRALPALQS